MSENKNELEREVKLFYCPDATFERLIDMGGELVKYEIQENIIYVINGEKIRLRAVLPVMEEPESMDGTSFEIIKKMDVNDSSTMMKTKLEIPYPHLGKVDMISFKHHKEFIEWLASPPIFEGVKKRKSISLNGFLFEFDVWNEEVLPIPYIELEIPESVEDVESALNEIMELVFTKEERDKIVISIESITTLSDNFKKTGVPIPQKSSFSDRIRKLKMTKEELSAIRYGRGATFTSKTTKYSECFRYESFNPSNYNSTDGLIIRMIIDELKDGTILKAAGINYYAKVHRNRKLFKIVFYNNDHSEMMITDDIYLDFKIKSNKNRRKIDGMYIRSIYVNDNEYRIMTETAYIKMLNLLNPLLSDDTIIKTYGYIYKYMAFSFMSIDLGEAK
jgi:hypothetical protein